MKLKDLTVIERHYDAELDAYVVLAKHNMREKGLKRFVFGLPAFVQPKAETFGMVWRIDGSGNILEALYDPRGDKIPEAGAIAEFDGKLWLGGDVVPFVSQLDMREADFSMEDK